MRGCACVREDEKTFPSQYSDAKSLSRARLSRRMTRVRSTEERFPCREEGRSKIYRNRCSAARASRDSPRRGETLFFGDAAKGIAICDSLPCNLLNLLNRTKIFARLKASG